MAHFAQINNNTVTQVIVVADADCGGGQFPESDPVGAAFCTNLLGGTWKQTSYNGNFRKRYAGIGYSYNAQLDAFIPPKPNDGKVYQWNEETQNWVEEQA